ncbi:hypothetical protein DFH07DRAFT_766548 [Mycena maculata]|uniref:F-box domain-containing protein n=1 Tax=Mycena maculata TaxID=230809 RepID=A0AAD7K486_9AGAR|nr:hypothetical protein DFH07DRAFT_766548 [Mycena maculata]
MTAAKDTVISAPELLELTLAQLPMRDLLATVPLVSRMWHAITLSPTLQRTLFFEPDPLSEPTQNPLLVELFPPFFTATPEDAQEYERCFGRWPAWPGTASTIMLMPWSKAPNTFKRKDASWRRMLVMQPPAKTMMIMETRRLRYGDHHRRAVLQDLSLCMGDLFDLAVPWLDYFASSFCIHWHHDMDQGDLTLAVRYTPGSSPRLEKKFYTDGTRANELRDRIDLAVKWETFNHV